MKRKRTTEFLVGLFMIIGFASIAYMTIRLGKLDVIDSNEYLLKAKFDNIQGLKKGSNVEISGISVGKVDRMYLDERDQVAIVEMRINNNVPVGDDVIASIRTSGLIGDKYVLLSLGGSEDMLQDGDMIVETESAVDIEGLVSKFAFGSVEE